MSVNAVRDFTWNCCHCPVKIIHSTAPKQSKMPVDYVRTQTLLCTLQRGESYHCTTGPVTDNSDWEVVKYMKYPHQDQACCKWIPPVLQGSLPTVDVLWLNRHDITWNQVWYHTWWPIDIIYDIIGQFLQSALPPPSAVPAAAASLRRFLVFAALNLLSGPALPEMLTPDPLRLGDRNHQGAAQTVEQYPDVHLVEPAAVTSSGGRSLAATASCTVLAGCTTGCSLEMSCRSCSMSAVFMQEGKCLISLVRIWASSSMSLSVRGPWSAKSRSRQSPLVGQSHYRCCLH